MGWNKNELDVLKSSSGGIFTALSSFVLAKDGVVFGVETLKTKNVFILKTTYTTDIEDIDRFRKSKYYQSRIDDAFQLVKLFLIDNRFVLFSGTPCQIMGLKSYLEESKLPENKMECLITVDVLCHGVSNEEAFNMYIQDIEEHNQKEVEYYDFRSKEHGWKNGSELKLNFIDGTSINCFWQRDPFYLAYNYNLSLRPSCYQCEFSNSIRRSDFSIGDYWGLDKETVDSIALKNGVGLICVNTEKAAKIWNSSEIKDNIQSIEIDYVSAITRNGALICPPRKHNKREFFFQNMRLIEFSKLVKRCLWKERFKIHIKSIFRIESVRRIDYSKIANKYSRAGIEEHTVNKRCFEITESERNNKAPEENALPVLFEKKKKCYGCYACFSICPVNAIRMEKDCEGFFYPQIDSEKCIRCKRCIRTCPSNCFRIKI